MARIRTIKPELFKHEILFDLEQELGVPVRLIWAGLFTICDREGRFKWRPRSIKADVFPFDSFDLSRVLDALVTRGFLVRYAAGADEFGSIPSWKAHQFINNKEPQSMIPEPPKNLSVDALVTRESPVVHATETRGVKEGKGMEGNGKVREGEVAPEKIARRVADRTGILTEFAFRALIAVCRREQNMGLPPDSIVEAMSVAWADYQASAPQLNHPLKPENFFGDGNWKDKNMWGWRNNGQFAGKTESSLDAARAAIEAIENRVPSGDFGDTPPSQTEQRRLPSVRG